MCFKICLVFVQADLKTCPIGSGPQTDYAVVHVFCAPPEAFDNGYGFWWLHESTNQYQRGPFRMARVNASTTGTPGLADYDTWQPVDSFSLCQDGLSNQFFIGEKHIPIEHVGKCGPSQEEFNDCTYLRTGSYSAGGYAQSFSWYFTTGDPTAPNGDVITFPLAMPNEFADDSPMFWYGFGSVHAGICNFLMGDGAVRSIGSTVPTFPILISLGMVDDGSAVSL